MDNRRNFVRYLIEAEVSFKTKEDAPKIIRGQVLDISIVGWGASFKENIDIGTVIQFDLTAVFLSDHLIGSGKVVNVGEHETSSGSIFRIGVEFIQVDKELVLRFINMQQRIVEERQGKIDLNKNRPDEAGNFGPF